VLDVFLNYRYLVIDLFNKYETDSPLTPEIRYFLLRLHANEPAVPVVPALLEAL
jgi:hypothetical protein